MTKDNYSGIQSLQKVHNSQYYFFCKDLELSPDVNFLMLHRLTRQLVFSPVSILLVVGWLVVVVVVSSVSCSVVGSLVVEVVVWIVVGG